MAVVTKKVRDGDGVEFDMQFWDDGSGKGLIPLHVLDSYAALNIQSVPGTITIDNIDFSFDNGTIRGLLADLPDPAAAHAATMYAVYWAVDTSPAQVYVTNGTTWELVD